MRYYTCAYGYTSSLHGLRLLPLPIPVQGLSSFDACSKSLGAAIGSLYELDWRRITKAEFLYDAERVSITDKIVVGSLDIAHGDIVGQY